MLEGGEGGGRRKLGADIISAVRGWTNWLGVCQLQSVSQSQPRPRRVPCWRGLELIGLVLSCCSPAGSCYSRPLCLARWRGWQDSGSAWLITGRPVSPRPPNCAVSAVECEQSEGGSGREWSVEQDELLPARGWSRATCPSQSLQCHGRREREDCVCAHFMVACKFHAGVGAGRGECHAHWVRLRLVLALKARSAFPLLSRAAALPHDKATVPARAHPACHGLMI